MSDYSRRTVRFDAEGDKKLKMMTRKENELRSQRGLEKISENTMIMDCIDYRYKEVYDKSRLKKEAEEEKIFYAKLNDKIISKYFNLLMDLLEVEVERINDLKLQISLLSSKEGTFEDVSRHRYGPGEKDVRSYLSCRLHKEKKPIQTKQ